MRKSAAQRIGESRLLLQNQYAYLDDQGGLSALMPEDERKGHGTAPHISASRRKLEDPYAHLDDHGDFSAAPPSPTDPFHRVRQPLAGRFSSLIRDKRRNKRHSDSDIEAKARELQKLMWESRKDIWPDGVPDDPVAMLDPALAFGLVGYDFEVDDTLGQYFSDGRQIEVAGIIDDCSMEVLISRQFPHEVRNFTAAHELGHALLHEARGLHRDRPLDGSTVARESLEFEADKFATYFLMPERLVRQRFEQIFGTPPFILNEDTSFALSRGNRLNLTACATRRDLSRILASVEGYNGVHFQALAGQFSVSVEAMAIRLEELGLV